MVSSALLRARRPETAYGEVACHSLLVEIISETEARGDIAGILSELLAQSGDIHVDGAVGDKNIGRPDMADEVVAREDASRMLEEGAEDAVLGLREAAPPRRRR